ncbi:hypothetical protein MAPG_10521 [Magnaporthiopsis poae ATCC 64411]|uniref:Chitin synthase n=1 Tax=Magnaporthiopsis poae (strain ATCC 64411 / 73-15) TaxID=644358 RepID=A0A0C4ECT6_MAGP6|nr:hypothetical protein MAPG_10521 [Magnaporthiopsis poae ATCC 64411]
MGGGSPVSCDDDDEDSWIQRQQPNATPAGGLKRYATRKVKLVQGSVLSINYNVPSAIRNAVQPKYRDLEGTNEEFVKIRYTAATCDPDEFTLKNGYDLRPWMYSRHTELLIAITYYNEDKMLTSRTLHSVMQNIRDIVNLKKSTLWHRGGPAWQKIVVVLLFDGVDNVDHGVLDVLATMGVYQHGVTERVVDGHETQAHVFEYTTQLSVTPDSRLVKPVTEDSTTLPPIQVILCMKTKRAGKINSHRWLYNAFGRILNPEVIVTVDTGTRLCRYALLEMWAAFYNDKDLGAACGEIRCHTGKFRSRAGLVNPIVASQNFEYVVAFQLERSFEAAIGWLTVLPGAFSAYRFRAIVGYPLDRYFHGDPSLARIWRKGGARATAFGANRFLAEDRVVAYELLAGKGKKWHSDFINSARAETDIPCTTADFISQRRRWLNGAFTSTLYSIGRFYKMYRSGHSIARLAAFHVELAYNLVTFLVAWFSLAGYLLTMFVVNDVTGNPPDGSGAYAWPFGPATPVFNGIIQFVYILVVVLQFVLALGSHPRRERKLYLLSFIIFSFVQLYLFLNLIYLVKRLLDFRREGAGAESSYNYINEYYSDVGPWTVLITGVSVFGVYIAAGILHLDMWHLFTSYASYLFVLASYINILSIYAFSNTHDITWGRKSGRQDLNDDFKHPLHPPARASASSQGGVVIEEVQKPQEDIDTQFEAVVKRALTPYVPPTKEYGDGGAKSRNTTPEEDFKSFRTKLVGVYIFSNFLMCAVVLNDSFQSLSFLGDPYWHKIWFFRVWMWANAGVLLMRLAGCCWFTVFHRGWRLLFWRY